MSNQKLHKKSIGIACCRRNNNQMEILLVQRRVTYAFQDLIFGKYKMKSINKIKFLIKNMTAHEQSELITRQFDILWWEASHFLPADNINLFTTKKNKFETVFGLPNSVIKPKYDLIKLINESSYASPYWEIPKGRHKSNKEADLNCAVRELEEETNICKSMYRLIFKSINYSYEENNIVYSIDYYPAIALYNFTPKLSVNKENQLCEVINTKWMSLNAIRMLDNRRLYNLVNRIFSVL